MTNYPRAYEALARNTGLDDRVFELVESVLTLEGLTQQMLTRLDIKKGGSGIGPTRYELELRCAAANADIYKNLDLFLSQRLAGYSVDNLEIEKRPVYVTRGGKEIPGTRKKAILRLHSPQLEIDASKFQRGDSSVSYNDGMAATYAPRTFVILLIYDQTNLDFIELQGDPVIKERGEMDPDFPDNTILLHD